MPTPTGFDVNMVDYAEFEWELALVRFYYLV